MVGFQWQCMPDDPEARQQMKERSRHRRMLGRLQTQGYFIPNRLKRVVNKGLTEGRSAVLRMQLREACPLTDVQSHCAASAAQAPQNKQPAHTTGTSAGSLHCGGLSQRFPRFRPHYRCLIDTYCSCNEKPYASYIELHAHITRTHSAEATKMWKYTAYPERTTNFRARGGWESLDAGAFGSGSVALERLREDEVPMEEVD